MKLKESYPESSRQRANGHKSHSESLFYQIYGPKATTDTQLEAGRKEISLYEAEQDELTTAAEEMAEMVAHGGDKLESIAKNFYGNLDKEMSFLFDTSSTMYIKYRQKVEKLRKAVVRNKDFETAAQQDSMANAPKDIIIDNRDIESYSMQLVTNWRMKEVIDKKILQNGLSEYLVSWEGLDNTWEPEDSLSCQQLIAEYERRVARKKAACEKHEQQIRQDNFDGPDVECIIGATQVHNKLKYMVKVKNSMEAYFISSRYARTNYPEKVIQYLERRIIWE